MLRSIAASVLLAAGCAMTSVSAQNDKATTTPWSVEKANEWYDKKGWLAGTNYAPAYAINQLEMWQAETFDIEAIDRELALAESLGFNSMRVFLHHALWEQDKDGFLKRIEEYLACSEKHNIGTMLVLFDSVWDPHFELGKQREPRPNVHNSGWVQSPGAEILKDPAKQGGLEDYVKGIITHFKDDKRVEIWDLWNEPDNRVPQYPQTEPANKAELVLPLLRKSFEWAREVAPSQPLTSGVWVGNWPDHDKLNDIERVQIEYSDVLSFHTYEPLDRVKLCVEHLQRYNRPIFCTEYMARTQKSDFDPILGYFKEQKVGAYNWGFVSGKSQTIFPWDSWEKEYEAEPPLWFHDILREDGTPYKQEEVDYIRRVMGVSADDKGTTTAE